MGVTRGVGEYGDVVVAVDGGGSKTDAVVADSLRGAVLGRARGPGCSQHVLGPEAAALVIDRVVGEALRVAGCAPGDVLHAGCYLTAMDLPDEEAVLTALLARAGWASRSLLVANDVFAVLRAGTDEPDAAVVVCGTGINGAAVRADGTAVRVPALGRCSGDWGGGAELAERVLWHAARAEDGRDGPTALRDALLRWTGARSVRDVSVAVHQGRMDPADWRHHVPEVFTLAAQGDPAATSLVRRQGQEIGLLAAALLERAGLVGPAVPVVLGGGIAASGDPLLMAAAADALDRRVPAARLVVPTRAPVEGALDLALAGARPA